VFYKRTNVKKHSGNDSRTGGSEVESEASNNEPATTRARVAAKNDFIALWFVVTSELFVYE
jgi:hypothetical protein